MFDNNYNSELAIKNGAKILMYCAYAIMGLFALGAIIMLFIDFKMLWTVSLAILVMGAVAGFSAILISHLVWGFGDVVGNVRKSASKPHEEKMKSSKKDENALPEL